MEKMLNKKKVKPGLIAGVAIFAISLLLGTVFNILAVWSDVEGMSFWSYPEVLEYNSMLKTDGELGSLECPVILSAHESATVKVPLINPTDRPIKQNILAIFSKPGAEDDLERDAQVYSLEPGEKLELSWQIDGSNMLPNHKILVRVFLAQSQYHPPSDTLHCGIMVVELGRFSGLAILGMLIGASLLGMVLGYILYLKNTGALAQKSNRAGIIMTWMLGITVICWFTNLMGWMVAASLMVILIALSFIAMIEALFTSN